MTTSFISLSIEFYYGEISLFDLTTMPKAIGNGGGQELVIPVPHAS
jgi:hypothetical protein